MGSGYEAQGCTLVLYEKVDNSSVRADKYIEEDDLDFIAD